MFISDAVTVRSAAKSGRDRGGCTAGARGGDFSSSKALAALWLRLHGHDDRDPRPFVA
jgi:hypothetical protein